MTGELAAEGTGETVGEAKWNAVRELERLAPGLDRDTVRFEVVSEGERGLLGVGYEPARVIASADAPPEAPAPADEGPEAARLRELVERVASALDVRCTVRIEERDDELVAVCAGPELGPLIGRHGQTLDAVQFLANAIAFHRGGPGARRVTVDAAGYRERRRETLETLAVRAAERVVRTGAPEELEPMSSIERRVVHERLKEYPGVTTSSDGAEPSRYVVVHPA